MQEMVVAFNGRITTLPESECNHAEGYTAMKAHGASDFDILDDPRHDVSIVEGGIMDGLHEEKVFPVNSVHKQGITLEMWNSHECQHLREVFRIEAIAPDDVIEGISAHPKHNKRFYVGLQAHFELQGDLHTSIYKPFLRHIHDYEVDHRAEILEHAL